MDASWEKLRSHKKRERASISQSLSYSAKDLAIAFSLYLAAVLLWVAALFFSGSRTALLFGGVMLLLGMAYLVCKKILPLWALFVILAAAAAIALLLGQQLHELFFGSRGDADAIVEPNERRWSLLRDIFAQKYTCLAGNGE